MPQLPTIDNCTACGACIDSCSHKAIRMEEDINGFYNIVIDSDKCIECKLCETKCHILNQKNLMRHDPCKQPLAGWSMKEDIIKNSATGGIFAQIAYDMLAEGNTYVYGASLQDDSSVRHIEISSCEEIHKLQNSKYQQSVTTGIFKQVKSRLKEGYRVLFSGVPCQVAALYAFMGNKADLTNLYTIEVICHGVPTNYLHRLGIRYNKAKSVVAYRTKQNSGWIGGRNNRVVYQMPDGTLKYMSNTSKDFLFSAYLSFSFSFSRKNCYTCKYSALKRVSDLTIGDFWGFEKSPDYARYGNFMGTSVILCNSEKGKNMVKGNPNIHTTEAKWEEILPLNQNLYMPTNRFIFNGYDKVNKLMKLPEPIRHMVFMNGSTNKYLNKIYKILFNKLSQPMRRKQENEITIECRKALEYLNNNE